MQNLKVRTFHPTLRNAMVFVLLSMAFIVLQRSLQSGLPFMNSVFLMGVARDEWPLAVLALPVLYGCWRHRTWSRTAFAVFCTWVAFKGMEGLFLNFDKMVLVVLFFQVVFSYAFYQLLTWTFGLAFFSPNYQADTQHPPMGLKVPAVFTITGSAPLTGRLTNWDRQGAFVHLDVSLPPGAVVGELAVIWEGRPFKAKGAVVAETWDGRGIGIEWQDQLNADGGWAELVALFEDYGNRPGLLR
jgi:hypothetical protein